MKNVHGGKCQVQGLRAYVKEASRWQAWMQFMGLLGSTYWKGCNILSTNMAFRHAELMQSLCS